MAEYTAKSNNLIKPKKINIYLLFTAGLFIALILLEIFYDGSFLDEVIGILGAAYLLFFRSKLERRDIITIILIGIIVVFGLISNIISGVKNNWFSILVDVVSETKIIFAYYGIKYLLTDDEKQQLIDKFTPAVVLYTLAAFFFGVLTLFVDTGMRGLEERFGLMPYKFIYTVECQFLTIQVFIFAILVCSTRITDRFRYFLYFCALASMLLTTKSPGILLTIMFVGLSFYFKKHKKLSPFVILIGIVLIFWASQFQIENYITNTNSIRYLFLVNSFKTAGTYFPFGSGFATYGSDQAFKDYSQLYYQYGYYKMLGLDPIDGSYTSDTFWPMAIAQFGWFGFILYFYVYVRIFQSFTNEKITGQRKAFLYASFIQAMIYAIGAANLSSSYGMVSFMALALVNVSNPEEQKKKRLKLHF